MDCPLCGAEARQRSFVRTQETAGGISAARRCGECSLLFLEDHAEDRSHVYGHDYGAWGSSSAASVAASKREAFRPQLARLLPHVDPAGKRLLDVGTGKGYLLDVARDLGFECHGVELSPHAAADAENRFPGRIKVGTLQDARYEDGAFDVIALTDLIEHVSDPKALFAELRRITRPGGHLFIITPNTDSVTRKLLGGRWFQYKYEHVIYWNPASLRRALGEAGFRIAELGNNVKRFRLSYYDEYFRRYALFGGIGTLFRALFRALPSGAKEWPFSNPVTGEMLVVARREDR